MYGTCKAPYADGIAGFEPGKGKCLQQFGVCHDPVVFGRGIGIPYFRRILKSVYPVLRSHQVGGINRDGNLSGCRPAVTQPDGIVAGLNSLGDDYFQVPLIKADVLHEQAFACGHAFGDLRVVVSRIHPVGLAHEGKIPVLGLHYRDNFAHHIQTAFQLAVSRRAACQQQEQRGAAQNGPLIVSFHGILLLLTLLKFPAQTDTQR